MTRKLLMIAGVSLGTSLGVWASQAPPKPGPEQNRLAVFVGTWTFEGELKAGPAGAAGKVTGTDHNTLLGGFFLERRFEEDGPAGKVTGVMLMGYDPVKKTYFSSGFTSLGDFDSGPVSVSGNTWTFASSGVSGGKASFAKCPLTFGPGNTSFAVKCEASADGKTWAPNFEGKWTKAK